MSKGNCWKFHPRARVKKLLNKALVPFNWPNLDYRDIEALNAAATSGHIAGGGEFTNSAEKEISGRMLIPRTLITTSCTSALEIAALLLSKSSGNEVIVPSFTFVSTASAFAINGFTPVFVDSKSDTLNIDVEAIEKAITTKTRAICLVHYGGIACEMEKIINLAESYNLPIIEDNAHGLYAKYKGKYLGTFGSTATQSFHETKNITCGEGGALLINDENLIEKAEIIREKGTNRSKFLRGQVDKYTWVEIGSSWVISDLLAAILCSQLKRADEINKHRVDVWNKYQSELRHWAVQNGVATPFVPSGCEHTGHVFHLRFRASEQRSRFISHLKDKSVSAVFHYQPLHNSPIGRTFGGFDGQCPVAENAGECLVRLPLFNSMTEEQQNRVISATTSFIC